MPVEDNQRDLEWHADEFNWAAKLIEEMERDPASRITEGDLQRRGVDPATARRHFLRR